MGSSANVVAATDGFALVANEVSSTRLEAEVVRADGAAISTIVTTRYRCLN
jgi:hypothetical protein